MSAISSIAVRAATSAARIGFPTLYGRLPATSTRPSRGRAIAPYSHARASASTTSTDGKRARSRSTSPRSTSSATTRPARRASSPVSAPSPGPISITRAIPASRRKCWPSARRLVARTPPRLEVGQEGRVDAARLGDRRLAIARVVDDVVRQLGLLRDGHLAPDPLLRLRGAHRVARREAPGLRRRVRDDHDEAIHGRVVPALDHHRGVEDHDAGEVARLELGEGFREPLADPWMGDRLEALLRVGHGEDDRAELLAVERPVGPEDPAPERRDDVVVRGRTGDHHLDGTLDRQKLGAI